MKGKLSKLRTGLLAVTFAAAAVIGLNTTDASAALTKVSPQTQACLGCHKGMNPALVQQWGVSKHAGAGVGCYECHQAQKTDKDAMQHFGFTIAVIVSPKDCGKCHPKEAKEFLASHHAKANKFVGSLDNVLGRVVTGEANFNLGCAQCHGSNVEVGPGGKLKVGPWPNMGIGRANPDGTLGACSACHYRHTFSLKQVRQPEMCGKCHQGPDHPQIEIWELSKHGIAYKAHESEIEHTLDNAKWVLGEDYYQAPNCVTCHMGATVNGVKGTHDVGARISWNLRAPISFLFGGDYDKLKDKRPGLWKKRRAEMKKVCLNCHQKPWVDGFYTQLDEYVRLYNEKFALPAKRILSFLHKNKVLDPTPFNEITEIDFWHLWHHEGRRGRHGAAMNAPDWSHWHGMYEVALNFYFHLLPHADKAVQEAYKKGKISKRVVREWQKLKSEILNSIDHKWVKGLPKEELRKIAAYYKNRYGQTATH